MLSPAENRPEYEELVDTLARHVHTYWLRDDGLGIETFDHNYCSNQQIPAAVLAKLGILKRVGDGIYGTPLAFDCLPEEFEKRAAENRERGCAYDTVVLSLLAIMEYGKPEDELHACLARLGICELDGEGQYVWTEKRDFYMKELYPRWTSLIV